MKESIIKALYSGGHFAYESEITWLKSFRSQPHWKPSEAEVKALEGAYLFWRGATNRTPDIRSLELLYDDLKKL